MRARLWPLILLAGCAGDPGDQLFEGNMVFVDAAAVERERPAYSGPDYFPASLNEPTVRCKFGDPKNLQPILTEFEERWYSRQLAAAGEPSLYLRAQEHGGAIAETLRFTWLRTFHAPVVIRIESGATGERRMIAKQLSGAGGYDPGNVAKTVERLLTAAEAEQLRAAVGRSGVFTLPRDPCGGGCDGAEWIFEEVQGTQYRFTSFWTPEKTPAGELGRFLIRLAGWEFESVY